MRWVLFGGAWRRAWAESWKHIGRLYVFEHVGFDKEKMRQRAGQYYRMLCDVYDGLKR